MPRASTAPREAEPIGRQFDPQELRGKRAAGVRLQEELLRFESPPLQAVVGK
jgi:hypothetical protein